MASLARISLAWTLASVPTADTRTVLVAVCAFKSSPYFCIPIFSPSAAKSCFFMSFSRVVFRYSRSTCAALMAFFCVSWVAPESVLYLSNEIPSADRFCWRVSSSALNSCSRLPSSCSSAPSTSRLFSRVMPCICFKRSSAVW